MANNFSSEEIEEMALIFQNRFEKNMKCHEGLNWGELKLS
jgi:hypothetical protein